MTHDAYVRARSIEDIERAAQEFACLLDITDDVPRDLWALACGGFRRLDEQFRYEVVDDAAMPGREGQTLFSPIGIRVPDRTHRGLRINDYRARFTLAHELGHVALHPYQELNRHTTKAMEGASIPPTLSAEWQANKFAAAFLMPKAACRRHPTPDALSMACLVSVDAARIRLSDLGIYKPAGEMTPRIVEGLNAIRRAAGLIR